MTDIKLTYEERNALTVLREAVKRKPEIAVVIMECLPRDAAVAVLLRARRELDDLLEINRAFVAAASQLAKMREMK